MSGASHRPAHGVWVFPSTPAITIIDAIVAAEELGIDEFWLGDEGPARDPFTVLAAAAMRTSRILLGIAVTNPYLRHPLTIAAEAMTVDELSGGRMRLGIGPGGQVALGPAGVERTLPLTRVRDALRTIRAVASGTEAAGYTPPPGAFARPALKVFVGSRGQKFQELASAEADGAFLGGLPASVIERTVGWARSVRDIPIALYSTGVFGVEEADALRAGMIMPLADSPEHSLLALGLDRQDVLAAAEALAAGDEGPARKVVSPAVFDDLVLSGSTEDIGAELANRVRRYSPASIGMTFTTNDPLSVVESSAAAFEVMDRLLG
jgi:5,10-methylenetetrahydromethanopterin reductase